MARMHANIQRMQARMNGFGVCFRPHVKTTKCLPVARKPHRQWGFRRKA
jgi:D-serine deaminase-like pyridoxal phosphate-dependent protein